MASVLTHPDVLCDAIISDEGMITTPKLVVLTIGSHCIKRKQFPWFKERLTQSEWEDVARQRLEVWGYVESDNNWWYSEDYMERSMYGYGE